jgi:integrase
MEYLTQQQLHHLLSLADAPRDRLLMQTMYQTGCTVGELVTIRATDIQERAILIHNRACQVSPQLTRELHAYCTSHASVYAFPTRQSGRMTEKRVQQLIKGYLARLGLPLRKPTPHVLRYTHVAHALEKRIPLRDIMQQTGLKEQRLAQLAASLSLSEGYGRMFP